MDVIDRVVALRGWPTAPAEAAVAARLSDPQPGALASALEEGSVVRAYAFRGASYVMSHPVAATVLAVRRTSRVWEQARYQRQGGFELADWGPWRAAVRDALADGPATRAEIWARARGRPGLAGLEQGASGAGSDSLYKPLHWWGDICFGPDRDGVPTFRLLAEDPRWPGTPEPDDAGPQAVRDYLASYAPATRANLRYWLTEGLSAPWRRVAAWLAALGDEVTTVDLDGAEAFVLTADLEDMAAAHPDDDVLHLPPFDPWVNGPGTADELVVQPALRAEVTRGHALEVRGGVVVATRRASAVKG